MSDDGTKHSGSIIESAASGATFGASEYATGSIKTDTVASKIAYASGVVASVFVPGAALGRLAQGTRLGYAGLKTAIANIGSAAGELSTASRELKAINHLKGASGKFKPESPRETDLIHRTLSYASYAKGQLIDAVATAAETVLSNGLAIAGSDVVNKRVSSAAPSAPAPKP